MPGQPASSFESLPQHYRKAILRVQLSSLGNSNSLALLSLTGEYCEGQDDRLTQCTATSLLQVVSIPRFPFQPLRIRPFVLPAPQSSDRLDRHSRFTRHPIRRGERQTHPYEQCQCR